MHSETSIFGFFIVLQLDVAESWLGNFNLTDLKKVKSYEGIGVSNQINENKGRLQNKVSETKSRIVDNEIDMHRCWTQQQKRRFIQMQDTLSLTNYFRLTFTFET